MRYILGIDVGGTFTDVFCLDRESGRTYVAKAPSTPATPGQDVIDAIGSVGQALGFTHARGLLSETKLIFHGSTVATNAMLTLKAKPVGLLTTTGFRDIVEMRGGIREETFNNRLENAIPLSPRHLRFEVDEWVDRSGTVVRPINAAHIEAAIPALQSAGVRSLAICFKNAYANSANEEAAERLVRERWPDAFITRSTALTNRIRLYDRVSSAVVNSFVGAQTKTYIQELQQRLDALGFRGRLLIMGGNGGVMSPLEAARFPAKLIVSGPAGGPVAGQLTLAALDRPADGIVVDMGGTSFDVSVIRAGRVPIVSRREVNRHRIAVPMLDIHTLAAGGGSIAWLDHVGLLKVGPHSAGSTPGPACYGLGGQEPTVTDANVVLGYLDPAAVLGGSRGLDQERASNAIRTKIAEPLGLTVQQAAAGIHSVATANMIVGVREMTVERGIDPRRLPLILAGGAAGLHGAEIAQGLGIAEVIAPRHAGVYCALGMAMTTVRYDHSATLVQPVSELQVAAVRSLLDNAYARLREAFADLKEDLERLEFELEVEARYLGQFHELTIPVQEADLLNAQKSRLREFFHQAHTDAYGFAQRDNSIEVVNVRVTGVGVLEAQTAPSEQSVTRSFAHTASRRIWASEAGEWHRAEAYALMDKSDSKVRRVHGPSLIDLPTSTVLVPSGWMCSLTEAGDLSLARGEREGTTAPH